jgi:6-phosphogluconolactonase
MKLKVKSFDSKEWPLKVANILQRRVKHVLLEKGVCTVMLTGGRSARSVYKLWRNLPDFKKMSNVRFYFSDERCVPHNNLESNYGMTMKTLFYNGIPDGCSVHSMLGGASNWELSAEHYESLLPEVLDVLLLSIGEDGHIASIFPGSKATQKMKSKVVRVLGPKHPYERLTISASVILGAASLFVMAQGETKVALLNEIIKFPNDISGMPARLALDATWLVDCNQENNYV